MGVLGACVSGSLRAASLCHLIVFHQHVGAGLLLLPPLNLAPARCCPPAVYLPFRPCRYYPGCLYGASSYVEAFTFTIVTHMTIGALYLGGRAACKQ